MGAFVTTGATMTCSFGLTPCPLVVLPARTVMLNGRPKANIMDFAPITNIASFGMCSAPTNPTVIAATAAAMGVFTPMPCIPAIVSPWIPGYPQVLVQGMPALTDDSRNMCMWLGVISFNFDGQIPLPPIPFFPPIGKPNFPTPIRMPLTSADFAAAGGGGGGSSGGANNQDESTPRDNNGSGASNQSRASSPQGSSGGGASNQGVASSPQGSSGGGANNQGGSNSPQGSGGVGGAVNSKSASLEQQYKNDVKKAEGAGKQQEMMSKACEKVSKESAQAGDAAKATQAEKMAETALATATDKKNDAVGDVNQRYRETMPPPKAQMDKLTPAQQNEYHQQRESIRQQKENTCQKAEADYQAGQKNMMAATTRDLKMHYAEKQEQKALKELNGNTFRAL